MAKTIKTLINCDCKKLTKFNKLSQFDQCICTVGTSRHSDRRVVARRVNVTLVDKFGYGE